MKQFNLQKKSFILINGRRQHKIQGRKIENKSTKNRKKIKYVKRQKKIMEEKNERKIWKEKWKEKIM